MGIEYLAQGHYTAAASRLEAGTSRAIINREALVIRGIIVTYRALGIGAFVAGAIIVGAIIW